MFLATLHPQHRPSPAALTGAQPRWSHSNLHMNTNLSTNLNTSKEDDNLGMSKKHKLHLRRLFRAQARLSRPWVAAIGLAIIGPLSGIVAHHVSGIVFLPSSQDLDLLAMDSMLPQVFRFTLLSALFVFALQMALFWYFFGNSAAWLADERSRGRSRRRADTYSSSSQNSQPAATALKTQHSYDSESGPEISTSGTTLFGRFARASFARFCGLVPIFYAGGVVFGAPLWGPVGPSTIAWAALHAAAFAVPGGLSEASGAQSTVNNYTDDDENTDYMSKKTHRLVGMFLSWLSESLALDDATATAEWQLSAWGAVLGAWIGALVIPLDWDRPWQRWPVPCVLGALAGHSMGSLLAACVVTVRRRRESKRDV